MQTLLTLNDGHAKKVFSNLLTRSCEIEKGAMKSHISQNLNAQRPSR
jgi:hypothetical protein